MCRVVRTMTMAFQEETSGAGPCPVFLSASGEPWNRRLAVSYLEEVR